MEKSITTSRGDFKVRELTIDEGLDTRVEGDPKTKTYEFVIKCIEPKMTVDEFKVLGFRDGLALINAVNEVNGLVDFQKLTTGS